MRFFCLIPSYLKHVTLFVMMLFSASQVLSQNEAIELPNKNYILPNAVSMWPPVWWSWVVLLAVIISLIGISIFFIKHYNNNSYRREAVKLLQDTEKLTDIELLTLCHQTIRRCLITKKRHDLASLPSHDLFLELDQSMTAKISFTQLGMRFINGAYQPNLQLSDGERDTILQTTIYWCRRHNA